MNDRAYNIVIYVVLAVWVMNFLAGLFQLNGYTPDREIHAIFSGIVGVAFVAKNVEVKRKSGSDQNDHQ